GPGAGVGRPAACSFPCHSGAAQRNPESRATGSAAGPGCRLGGRHDGMGMQPPTRAAPLADPRQSAMKPVMTRITSQIVAEHGLTQAEYETVLAILGREPNLTELGIFSVMWSEHCSYKSSKKWLKTLPTSGPQVIQGPGENAG